MATTFGNQIRELRKQQRLTLRRLAELTAVSFTYLSKLENGKQKYAPSESFIRRLAEVLATDADALLVLGQRIPSQVAQSLARHPQARALMQRAPQMTGEDWRRVGVLLPDAKQGPGGQQQEGNVQSVTLVDAADLDSWAGRQDAPSVLPQLIRKLILATVPFENVSLVQFPAAEQIRYPGWDGTLKTQVGNAFVPVGASCWELSVEQGSTTKANQDYKKRSQAPLGLTPGESVYVCVTPRNWSKASAWAKERRAEKVWADVRAYDAGQLATWLEQAPAVHYWFSLLLGKRPESVIDLETYWQDWSEMTEPALTPALVLAGREEVGKRIGEWCLAGETPLELQAETNGEAVALVAAAMAGLPAAQRDALLSRTIVVGDLPSWQRLCASTESLILIPAFPVGQSIGQALRRKHRVIFPLELGPQSRPTALVVPRIDRQAAQKLLIGAGVKDARAEGLALLAHRSLESLRRELATSPALGQPKWAEPSAARVLIPAMLAGTWDEARTADKDILAELAAEPYEAFAKKLIAWSRVPDSPIRRTGSVWSITAKEDAWKQLSSFATRDDLDRLSKAALRVLGTADPGFELPDDQRWLAGLYLKTPEHSALLHEGMADTLALIGARGEEIRLGVEGTAVDLVRGTVRQLLDQANGNWRLWASLYRSLPLLAEAAPDELLQAVDRGASGQDPALLNLFREGGDAMTTSSPHPALLWSLETLAWSPTYLGEAARLLAKLAQLDPGGTIQNRPDHSLREIFLPWVPQTMAPLEKRLKVLDRLRKRDPEVGWKLLASLLPKSHDSSTPTPKPRYRLWVTEEPKATLGQVVEAAEATIGFMLEDVGQRGNHWQDLVEALPDLPPYLAERVTAALDELKPDSLAGEDRGIIWHALRKLISHHRSYATAKWALPKEKIDHLDDLRQRFEPTDPKMRFGWLFEPRVDLPEGMDMDWEAKEKAVLAAQVQAAQTLLGQGGVEALLTFAGQIKNALGVGIAAGHIADLPAAMEEDLIRRVALDDAAPRGFIAGRVRKLDRQWVEALLSDSKRDLSAEQRAAALICLPSDGGTWDLAAAQGPEAEQTYWRTTTVFGIPKPPESGRAVEKLLEYGRPYSALDLLAHMTRDEQEVAPSVIANALEQALKTPPKDDPSRGLLAHELPRLLTILDEAPDLETSRVARLEWAYLPALRHGYAVDLPKVLHRSLGEDPNLFVEVVCMAYRAKDQPAEELDEQRQAQARRAHDLLDSWRGVPGTQGDAVDAERLRDWVQRARQRLETEGRGVIGDQLIGQVLSGSPAGGDGRWPHEAVRDLIEAIESLELEHGIQLGLYNGRGASFRDPAAGGEPERALVGRYQADGAALGDQWPRTGAMLRRVADSYRREALREDQQSEAEDL